MKKWLSQVSLHLQSLALKLWQGSKACADSLYHRLGHYFSFLQQYPPYYWTEHQKTKPVHQWQLPQMVQKSPKGFKGAKVQTVRPICPGERLTKGQAFSRSPNKVQIRFSASPAWGKKQLMLLKWKRPMAPGQMTPADAGSGHLSSSPQVSSLRVADSPKVCGLSWLSFSHQAWVEGCQVQPPIFSKDKLIEESKKSRFLQCGPIEKRDKDTANPLSPSPGSWRESKV